MNNSLALKVVFLAIMLTSLTDLTHSIELNENIKNSTESVNFQIEQADDEYPSDSYYYDNYEANNDLNPDQIDKKQLFLNTNTNTQQTTHNNNNHNNNNNNNNNNKTNINAQQPQIIKQLENNLNSLIKQSNNNNNNNNHTGATYDYVEHEELEDVDTNTSGGNNEDEDSSETEDMSHVVIINAEQENDYQLDETSKASDSIPKPSASTTQIPEQHVSSVVSLEEKIINAIDTTNSIAKNNEYKKEADEHPSINEHKQQADFKSKTVASNRNYLTFLVILVSIGVLLTGLTIVIVLFVKRRSLLLKSKCQIVSKTKGQQSYTTVGQNDF